MLFIQSLIFLNLTSLAISLLLPYNLSFFLILLNIKKYRIANITSENINTTGFMLIKSIDISTMTISLDIICNIGRKMDSVILTDISKIFLDIVEILLFTKNPYG
tara:strand:+ start:177 stop:491 length:315 start_codon:yes stop_codon:yes gene_type:complete